jgi:hypothetical protein
MLNRFQPNAKTEFFWLASNQRLPLYLFQVGADLIALSLSVLDLSIYLEAELSMPCTSVRKKLFSVLHQLWNIRRSVPSELMQTLVTYFVISGLDMEMQS